MQIALGELSFDVVLSDEAREELYGGRWGWFWQESRTPARGPFGTPAEALADLAEWIGARFDAQGAPIIRPEGVQAALARTLLGNADGFLRGAEAATVGERNGEVVLASACYALELVFKSYLLSRGRSDDWNRTVIRNDLAAAYREATFLGLPGDDARIERFLKVAAEPFARHQLLGLAQARPNLLAEIGYVVAIRGLHREVERRLEP